MPLVDRSFYDLTMRSKRDQVTFTEQARRAQLIAAAIEVIVERGFPAMSLAKIADQVGIAKSVVLYHFSSKDALVKAVVDDVMVRGAMVMVPAMAAEATAAGKLSAYIRANVRFIDADRRAAVAMLEILTGFRTADGLRLDQAMAASVAERPPQGDLAMLDPQEIFEFGMRTGEFRSLSAAFMKNALRASIDGAVWELGRDLDYDVLAYGEELVGLFAHATRGKP